jgi:hypothetical protein
VQHHTPVQRRVRHKERGVLTKRWHNGDVCLRWTAARMLEAQTQFRRIIGHPKLAVAVERDVTATRAADTPNTTAHTSIATAAPEVAAAPA